MITQHVNPFLLLPIETFQLLLWRSHIYLRQQLLGWAENPVRHHTPDCCTTFLTVTAFTAVSQIVFPPGDVLPCHSQAPQSHFKCLRSLPSSGPTGCADPLTPGDLSWKQRALLSSGSCRGDTTSCSLRGGNDTKPFKI